MILFDTNILIDLWRKPEELRKFEINNKNSAICGPVKSELLHGAKTDDEADNMLGFFNSFENLIVDEYDWEFSGLMLQTIRRNGISVPVTDALIAYIAIKYDVPLWTKDAHFKFIQTVYPELKLYEL